MLKIIKLTKILLFFENRSWKKRLSNSEKTYFS